MIDIGTRKHGPFDPRYPRPRTHAADPAPEQSIDRESVEAWEGEGGQVDPRTRAGGGGNGRRRPELATLPDGLDWSSFRALVFPAMKRHYFPAIAPWYRYRDGDPHGRKATVESTPVALFAVEARPRAA